MEQDAINSAIRKARARWEDEQKPDRFHTTVEAKLNESPENINVHIYHHETFPLGAKSFTVDVRSLPDTPQNPGRLLRRQRIDTPPESP